MYHVAWGTKMNLLCYLAREGIPGSSKPLNPKSENGKKCWDSPGTKLEPYLSIVGLLLELISSRTEVVYDAASGPCLPFPSLEHPFDRWKVNEMNGSVWERWANMNKIRKMFLGKIWPNEVSTVCFCPLFHPLSPWTQIKASIVVFTDSAS